MDSADSKLNRREFLQKGAAVAAGGAAMSSSALSYSRIVGANDRISLGHIEFRTAVSDSDVSERDPVIRPDDAGVRESRTAHGCTSRSHGRTLLQKFSPVQFAVCAVHSSPPGLTLSSPSRTVTRAPPHQP